MTLAGTPHTLNEAESAQIIAVQQSWESDEVKSLAGDPDIAQVWRELFLYSESSLKMIRSPTPVSGRSAGSLVHSKVSG
jgi:hypothetical protein